MTSEKSLKTTDHPSHPSSNTPNTRLVAVVTIILALGAFFLMSFRIIPEIVFWIVAVPCTVIAYWLVPKMREKEQKKH